MFPNLFLFIVKSSVNHRSATITLYSDHGDRSVSKNPGEASQASFSLKMIYDDMDFWCLNFTEKLLKTTSDFVIPEAPLFLIF